MDVTRIPKIELHLHLDGAVPPETMWRMAQEKHVSLPVDTLDAFYAWLVKTADCRDVNTYLARFELPLQLMQDAPGITRITCDVLTTLARQGHIYDELRFAPQLHTRAGLRQQDAIEAVLAGREQALRAFPDYRCGILLCCMCIGPETANMAENLETVRLTQEYLGSGVVGMDLAGADKDALLRQLTATLSAECVDFSASQETRDEALALCDEAALEQLLERGKIDDALIAEMVKNRKVFPCFFGSALKLDGVEDFLTALACFTREPVYPKEFGAKVFKISRDAQGARLTWLKVTGGALRVKAPLTYRAQNQDYNEKADQLRLYSGAKYTLAEAIGPGQVCAVTGLTKARPGEGLGAERDSDWNLS